MKPFLSQSIVNFMKLTLKQLASSDTEDMSQLKKLNDQPGAGVERKEGDKQPEDISIEVNTASRASGNEGNGTPFALEFDKVFDQLTVHLDQLTQNIEANLGAQIRASIGAVVAKQPATAMQGVGEEFNTTSNNKL